jgi:hypothetical protein
VPRRSTLGISKKYNIQDFLVKEHILQKNIAYTCIFKDTTGGNEKSPEGELSQFFFVRVCTLALTKKYSTL